MPPGSASAPLAAAAAAAAVAVAVLALGVCGAIAAPDITATDPAPTTGATLTPQPADEKTAPEVQVTQGRMRGAVLQSRGGRTIYAYLGIPYAQPPVGALRFQAPVPAVPWDGVLNATQDGAMCVQKNYLVPPYPVSGSEDCLFINVFAPKVERTTRLPVIVYIHGGGFFAGTGASAFNGPQYLLDHDVLLVTLNYRLGALGFLSSGDERAPGNAGLKDQTLALRWVRQNIDAFGGDPNLVTIMGQSAGAASVHYHILSPLSRGLFHRAISQSGWALAPWALPVDPAPIALKQAEFVGCNAVSMDDALACLRHADAYNITETGHRFHFWDIDPLTVFRPVVEASRHGAFLVDEPAAIIQLGDFAHVPWLTGAVTQEGIIRALPILRNASLTADLNARWDEIMPQLMELGHSAEPAAIPAIWRNISQFYVGDAQPHVDISNPYPFIDLYSDRGFLQGFKQAAQLHARAGHKRIFLYEFGYRGNFSYSMLFGGEGNFGVSHCDDLLYLFYAPALFPQMAALGSADDVAVRTATQLWANFAKYGDPTPRLPEPKSRKKSFPSPHLSLRSRDSARSEDNHTEEEEQCWTNFTEARWAPYEPSARPADFDLHFLRFDTQPVEGAADAQTAEGKLRMCMRKGFHKRRQDFWTSLPLKENKASGIGCKS